VVTQTALAEPSTDEIIRLEPILEDLRARVVERELELETLSARLRVFNAVYMRVVGHLLAELDGVVAELAELEAAADPGDGDLLERAEEACRRARESAAETGAAEEGGHSGFVEAGEALKKLYRKVARAVHPDFAASETDRNKRTELMKRANGAYGRGDTAALEALFSEAQESDTTPPGHSRLEQLRAEVARCEARLAAIAKEMATMEASPIAELKARVEAAAVDGTDLLAEMARVARMDLEVAITALNARRGR
jgi:hypothetical protein